MPRSVYRYEEKRGRSIQKKVPTTCCTWENRAESDCVRSTRESWWRIHRLGYSGMENEGEGGDEERKTTTTSEGMESRTEEKVVVVVPKRKGDGESTRTERR